MEITLITDFNKAQKLCKPLRDLVIPSGLAPLLKKYVAYVIIDGSYSTYPCRALRVTNDMITIHQESSITIPSNVKILIEIGTIWGNYSISQNMIEAFTKTLHYLMTSEIKRDRNELSRIALELGIYKK